MNGIAEVVGWVEETEVSRGGKLVGERGLLLITGCSGGDCRPNSSSQRWAERFDAWRSAFIHSWAVNSVGADNVNVREGVNIANANVNHSF